MPSQPSDMDASDYPEAKLEGGAAEDGTAPDDLHLIKPEGVKSRFWIHFSRYDLQFHPDKKTTARCNLCGKEISVKQGTGGLKNHLKFKHPEESDLLMMDFEEGSRQGTSTVSVRTTPSRGGTAGTTPAKKKPRTTFPAAGENHYNEITMRMEAEKRNKEKHLMEMWTITRCEIRDLRKELKEEEDEDVIRDVEADIRVLKKRKADYAEMLGFPKDDDMTTTTEHQEI